MSAVSVGANVTQLLRTLFGGYGRPLTIQRVTPGSYNPSSGATAAPTTVIFTGVGRLGNYSDYLTDGTLIKQNDRRVTFVADDPSFAAQATDQVLAGSDLYSIISLKPRELGGGWICWTFQARR